MTTFRARKNPSAPWTYDPRPGFAAEMEAVGWEVEAVAVEGRETARDVISEVLLDGGPVSTPRIIGATFCADRILAALATARHLRNQTLIDAVVAMLWSDETQREILMGNSDALDFEPWPERDRVMTELDVAAPGWRERTA